MNLAELKLELIRKIIATNDLTILMKIEAELNNIQQTIHKINEPPTTYIKSEKVLVLNEWQQARIDIALKQIENGEFLTEDEDKIEMEKWFKEEEKLYGQ
jgi:predicted transcriptional regulator